LTDISANNTVMGNVLIGTDRQEDIVGCKFTSKGVPNDNICFNNINASSFIAFDESSGLFEMIIETVSVWETTKTVHNQTQGDFIVDVDTLFVDVSTDRVGIGTESPSYTEHIVGDDYVTNARCLSSNCAVNRTYNGTCIIDYGLTATLEVC